MFAADTKRLIGRIWFFLFPYRGWLMLSLAFLCIAAPLAQVHPLVWKYVVDDVLLAGNAAGLWVALGVMLASQLAATLFAALQSYFIEKAGQGFVRDVRNAVFSHLEEQSMSYHHERHTGDLVARVISDVDAMETSVLANLSDLLGELVTFVVVAGVVIWLQPIIGLCVMIPLALSYIVVRRFSDRVKRVYEAVRARLGDIGTFVHDRLAGIQLAQSFAQIDREKLAFRACDAEPL